jgi:hypothetical protein
MRRAGTRTPNRGAGSHIGTLTQTPQRSASGHGWRGWCIFPGERPKGGPLVAPAGQG